MNIKFDRNAAEKLREEIDSYANQINDIVKEISNIIANKNNWTDDKRAIFNAHMQVISDNLAKLSKAQAEFATIYNQKIKELK